MSQGRRWKGRCAALGAGVALALGAAVATACENPDRHPGMAQFQALVEQLGEQPHVPVELRYLSPGMDLVGVPVTVRLSFWPTGPYQAGTFRVTPSDGLELIGAPGSADIPYKGEQGLRLRPLRAGYHHLRVDLDVTVDEVPRRRTLLLAMPAGQDHGADAPDGAGLGFAGPRMRGFAGAPEAAAAPGDAAEE